MNRRTVRAQNVAASVAALTSVAVFLAMSPVSSAAHPAVPARTQSVRTATGPSASQARHRLAAHARTAVREARRAGLNTGIAVLDTRTGTLTTAGAAHRYFPSASVVKVLIATRLLLAHRMHGRTAVLARRMITRSDNDAAWSLYPKVGRDGLLPWIAHHYLINGLGRRPAMKGVWGSTRITAAGMVRFYRAVRADHTVWPWLSRAMHHFAARSSAGEINDFGLAAVTPKVALKNGWDTHRDPAHPSHAIVNTTGVVEGRYAVAILGEGPGSLYLRPGEQIITRAARTLLRGGGLLTSRSAATRLVDASAARPRAKPIVVLDPGHNGGNASHPRRIDRQVPMGYGRHKACNTTGTATNSGYPEHKFTFDVAKRVRTILLRHGLRVEMTRDNDHGVGPCVNKRAAIESRKGVVAAVAIHADGAAPSGHGFHVCEDSRRPVGASKATVRKSYALGRAVHNALAQHSGFVPSTYLGHHGYVNRTDLAGLNLSTKPTTFLEIGNMRNAHDAARQKSAHGRARIARAIAAGILAYLSHS